MTQGPDFDLRGLWRRASITNADGSSDTTTLVYWLQAEHLFADIRLPPATPDLGGARGLEALNLDGLKVLAGFRGFAGRTSVADDLCTWHRPIDWQPESGTADIGRLWWDGADLIEDGVLRTYREVWVRETAPGQGLLALDLRDPADGRPGVLVRAADHFIYARGRTTPLPSAENLAVLLDEAPNLDLARSLFDAEVSYGRVGADWRIARSTLPWREGAVLLSGIPPLEGQLSVNEVAADGSPTTRTWSITSAEGAA